MNTPEIKTESEMKAIIDRVDELENIRFTYRESTSTGSKEYGISQTFTAIIEAQKSKMKNDDGKDHFELIPSPFVFYRKIYYKSPNEGEITEEEKTETRWWVVSELLEFSMLSMLQDLLKYEKENGHQNLSKT